MPEISAKDVQKLRQTAGVGMMDAKKALIETEGDFESAVALLKERGLAKVQKRAGEREASQGSIGIYLHHQAERAVIGVLIDLAAETDFVAKHPEFKEVADDIALHVAWGRPRWVRREDVQQGDVEKQRDEIAEQARLEGKPETIIPKIVEGRLKAFFEDHVLYEQKFVNPEKFEGTVEGYVNQLAAKMGENISVRRMARLEIGD